VGLGKMGMLHLDKLMHHPRVELVGVCDNESRKLQEIAKSFQIPIFSDPEALFFESDAAIIATPTATHYSLTQKALSHDLHVFVEKPICESIAEGLDLIKAAQKKNRILQTGFIERYRWMRLVREIPQLWNEKPRVITTERSSSEPSRDPQADIVTDLMIHDIDFVIWALGEMPTCVQAQGLSLRGGRLDLALAQFEFPSGAVASLKAQWIAPERKREAQIFWKTSALHFDLLSQKAHHTQFVENGNRQRIEIKGSVNDPLADQLEAFVAAIENSGSAMVSGQDGNRAFEVCQAIKDSIESKSLIELPLFSKNQTASFSNLGDYVN